MIFAERLRVRNAGLLARIGRRGLNRRSIWPMVRPALFFYLLEVVTRIDRIEGQRCARKRTLIIELQLFPLHLDENPLVEDSSNEMVVLLVRALIAQAAAH